MDIVKKILITVLEIALVLGFCGAVIFFLFPDMFGRGKQEEEEVTQVTEHITHATIQEQTTEATTEEVTEEETTEATTEATTEEKRERTSERASGSENVKDENAPFFMIFNSSPVSPLGEVFDIHKYVGYADDADRNVDLKVDGDVDIFVEGTYPIKVTITDDAGHSTSKDMEVSIVKKEESADSGADADGGGTKTYPGGEDFSKFIEVYKTDKTSVGIDVSRWQETIDFNKVKAAGCEFVYMRLGGYDNGEFYTDRYYKGNMAGAKAAGLKVGVYWHAEDGSPEEAAESAKYLMDVLGDETLDLPIAYDWEDFGNFEDYGMNLYDINKCYEAFANQVEIRGYDACLYSSKNFLENTWTNEKDRPVWLAHYVSSTKYSGKYFMWQHSSDGRIDGINGPVDLDVLYLD